MNKASAEIPRSSTEYIVTVKIRLGRGRISLHSITSLYPGLDGS